MSSRRVCLGVIVGAKGLKGEVRIKSFTAEPADVAAYGPLETEDGRQQFTLKAAGEAKGMVVARITGVSDRNAAEALKGLKLYVNRAALPETGEGTYYHADLIGLTAALTTGEKVGTISAFYNFGGGDVMEVATADGDKEMVPFTTDVIAEVDLAAKRVSLNPLKGVFGGPDEEDEDGNENGETEAEGEADRQ